MIFRLSNDFLMETFTLVDNKFLIEFLPESGEKEIKVYLYGLLQCNNPNTENALEEMATALAVSEDEILNIYSYWEECGLVQIVSKSPLEIRYMSMKRGNQPPKKFKKEKFGDFNIQLQAIFPDRQILPNEYNQYYEFIEAYKMDLSALIMICQYCKDIKGDNVRYPYILAVAKDWSRNGVKTPEDVETKVLEFENLSDSMRQILRAFGRKSNATNEEQQMLLCWTKSWGYMMPDIMAAIKINKAKSFKKLNDVLDNYYRLDVFTEPQMKEEEMRLQELRETAFSINKIIGVFYQNVEIVIETYIVPWMEKGFTREALEAIAKYCFKGGVTKLEGLNAQVEFFFKHGFITIQSIDDFLRRKLENDEKIKSIIEKTGRVRNVTNNDRESFKLWTITWGFSMDVLLFAAECASQRAYPIPYMNQLLKNWYDQGIKNIDQARNSALQAGTKNNYQNQNGENGKVFRSREYSKEELASIFQDNFIED